MQLEFLLEQVVNGLVLGGYYLLVALGLSLIFSIGGVVNLAHGAFYALGAYVSVAAASHLHARGVFLMAPALYVEGLPELRAGVLDCPASIVHGWRDEVVPYEHSLRFANTYRAALHLLESDHRLHIQLRVIQYLFEYFLIALDLPAIAYE